MVGTCSFCWVISKRKAGSGDFKDPCTVLFTYSGRKPFETLRNAIEQRIAERGRPTEVPETSLEVEPAVVAEEGSEAADVTATPVSKVAGGVEVLNKKLKKLAGQNMSQDEDIKLCSVSPNGIGVQA
jgi:hypothetical protein